MLITSTDSLECYYYRIRADEILTADRIMKRNCSTASLACLKIISRNEFSQDGPSNEGPTSVEGRCAFTQHECEGRIGQCVSEPPMVRFGITIHEHKCCSIEDLSNTASTRSLFISFKYFSLVFMLSVMCRICDI
ncbi:hypothetical protein RB195_005889 [Necator americanus]